MKKQLSYENISSNLRSHGLKVTQQRVVIYEALMGTKSHPTAEEIYETVNPKNSAISLATVYKTLDTFCDAGLARRVSSKGNKRYDGDLEKHHHIHCTNTNEIIDYKDSELLHLIKDHLSKKNIHNLEISDISVQINGAKIDLAKSIKIT